MRQFRIPAVFMRGGTSNAIVFHERDLPRDRALWDEIFLAAMGSPDPYGRQLNGMGGGISSLSKVCVIGPPSRPDADIDYTFAQVSVREASVSYRGNCGNMSGAMGPFAVDEGVVTADGDEAFVRIHNTNTKKIINARFPVEDGVAAVDGDIAVPGVAGTGAPVRLEFLDPGGAGTGKLLPTGNVLDILDVPGVGKVEASCIDAANPAVFVEASVLGLKGNEMPAAIDAMTDVMARMQAIRRTAAVVMGLADTEEEAARNPNTPGIGFIAPPMDAIDLTGAKVAGADGDITARRDSMGNIHRAYPQTAGVCTAVAARIEGTIVHRHTRPGVGSDIRIIHASGVTTVDADVRFENGVWHAIQAAVYRTHRRLFDGYVYVPASRVPGLAGAGPGRISNAA